MKAAHKSTHPHGKAEVVEELTRAGATRRHASRSQYSYVLRTEYFIVSAGATQLPVSFLVVAAIKDPKDCACIRVCSCSTASGTL